MDSRLTLDAEPRELVIGEVSFPLLLLDVDPRTGKVTMKVAGSGTVTTHGRRYRVEHVRVATVENYSDGTELEMEGLLMGTEDTDPYAELATKLYAQVEQGEDARFGEGKTSRQHLLWMLQQLARLSDREKKARWLGYVFGVLAAYGALDPDDAIEACRRVFKRNRKEE